MHVEHLFARHAGCVRQSRENCWIAGSLPGLIVGAPGIYMRSTLTVLVADVRHGGRYAESRLCVTCSARGGSLPSLLNRSSRTNRDSLGIPFQLLLFLCSSSLLRLWGVQVWPDIACHKRCGEGTDRYWSLNVYATIYGRLSGHQSRQFS